MRLCLIAGTINRYYPSDVGWLNYHVDVSPRPIWDAQAKIGVQPDFVLDIADTAAVRTTFREAMFEAVHLHHVLEHLPRPRGLVALENLAWLLADGGELDIEVPDFLRVARAWLADEIDHAGAEQWVLGEQLSAHEPGDSHRALYTELVLRAALAEAGFEVGDREETGYALRFVVRREPREEA